MTNFDTSFSIRQLETFHVANAGATYWEGYRGDAAAAGRYQFKPGWRTVYASTMESPLLRVTLADGNQGWGEATAPICPEIVCLTAERLVLPLAEGREFGHPLELWDFLYDAHRARGYTAGYYLDAVAALDVALWDALGKRNGVPVAAMLADAPRRSIPVYLSGVRRPSLADRIAHLRAWREQGVGGVKIFLDGDVAAGLAELQGLQAGVPDLERWMVDTLWMLDGETAPRAKQQFGELGVGWLECPLIPEDLPGHQQLMKAPGTAIALGEHFRSHYQSAPWLEGAALDIFQPDICRTGFSDGLRQRDLAAAAGIPTTPHMGAGFSIVQAAGLHFAAVCPPDLLCEVQAGQQDKFQAASSAWRFEDGAFNLPDRPGLGVEIDLEALGKMVVR